MNLAQMTSDASGLTGTNPTAPVNTTREGDWFQPPFVDARRSSLNTNDLRGKVLRRGRRRVREPHGLANAPAGLHDLFLVFRQAPGGPGNNFFNLNWVEFGGAGVGT